MDADRVVSEIAEAIAHADEGRLIAALYELGTMAMHLGEYDTNVFTSVVSILQTDLARKYDASWLVWKHFEENWDLLSGGSRARLRRAAEDEFGRSGEWMWSFAIGILLAECFADETAMGAFMRFRQSCDAGVRAVLPDAIRNLARCTTSEAVRRTARRELELLTQDPADEVRHEAALALARWK